MLPCLWIPTNRLILLPNAKFNIIFYYQHSIGSLKSIEGLGPQRIQIADTADCTYRRQPLTYSMEQSPS